MSNVQVEEVALMHSKGILAGEMMHEPLALVDDCMPVLVIALKTVCVLRCTLSL